ncbi:uncharacterized protein LOC129609246 [Condylostylus longicornis]|uniref:uncharacterized protein LOC129609246 n=1 Tax=Condylostylus longicornis TaxID=2530218 RepID=UPI00244E2853|nr:uncharacterized protein LOC129609246 [Condylostylus longicornis]
MLLFSVIHIKKIKKSLTKGLDEAHIKFALRKLAKLHATSAVLNEREPNSFKTYDRGFFNRHTNSYAKFGAEYIKYSEKIEKLVPQLMDIGRKLFDVQEHEFNSFVHGDFWVNNLLYKYDEKQINKPLEAIILDYQYSFYGSSVLDLLYFMNTSMKEELRLSEEDKYIQYYHNFLVEILKKLKFNGKIPTLHEFHIQYITKEFFAFHSSCVIQPVMLNEETEDADFNALMAEDERAFNFKRTIYKNKRVVQNLKNLLPHFDRRGILDTKLENLYIKLENSDIKNFKMEKFTVTCSKKLCINIIQHIILTTGYLFAPIEYLMLQVVLKTYVQSISSVLALIQISVE